MDSKLERANLRQLVGIFVCGAGGYLIFLAVDGFKKITEGKDFVHRFANFFQHNSAWNPVIEFFGGKAQAKISESELPAALTLATGIALVVIGTTIIFYFRKKSRFK